MMSRDFLSALALCGCSLVFAACDGSRIYEENVDFSDRSWLADDTKRFGFSVVDSTAAYNIHCNLRSTLDYPNYNLYIKYWLYDSVGRPVTSDLRNIVLFDPKTGVPEGRSSIGDIFSYQVPLIEDYAFDYPGNYTLVLQHFMRYDTLREVVSVGVRLERAN